MAQQEQNYASASGILEGYNNYLNQYSRGFWKRMGRGTDIIRDLAKDTPSNETIDAILKDAQARIDQGYFKKLSKEDKLKKYFGPAQYLWTAKESIKHIDEVAENKLAGLVAHAIMAYDHQSRIALGAGKISIDDIEGTFYKPAQGFITLAGNYKGTLETHLRGIARGILSSELRARYMSFAYQEPEKIRYAQPQWSDEKILQKASAYGFDPKGIEDLDKGARDEVFGTQLGRVIQGINDQGLHQGFVGALYDHFGKRGLPIRTRIVPAPN